jgi:hypothetical protein
MSNLIPGINSGLTMNPRYQRGTLPPFFGNLAQDKKYSGKQHMSFDMSSGSPFKKY